jgi:hypothetical protein
MYQPPAQYRPPVPPRKKMSDGKKAGLWIGGIAAVAIIGVVGNATGAGKTSDAANPAITTPASHPSSGAEAPVKPAVVSTQPASPTTVGTSAAPSPIDNAAFDLTGSGSDCVMTYGPSTSGGTLTVVTVDVPGEIITHISDSAGNIHRNDVQITQGPNAFAYDVPLSQVGDMGAVFYLTDGTSQSCTIKPAG